MLTYIETDKLHPHPDNPRKDLGDLTELSESIRASGVLQNLTVVPLDEEYRVVIGHRRLAAARIAGLTEMPCIVCDMTPQQQLYTMMTENLQRNDLTFYEQACGFQMMLDFGDTVESLAQKTGFSESTVRRRVKLLELDKTKLIKSLERQVSLADYDRLQQIEDIKDRNEALEKIGTGNFDWAVNTALRKQTARWNRPLAIKEISSYAERLVNEEAARKHEYAKTIWLYDWETSKTIPDDSSTSAYYYLEFESGIRIDLYKRKNRAAGDKRPQSEIDQEKAVKAREEELKELASRAFALRSEFITGLHPSGKMLPKLTTALCKATLYHHNNYTSFETRRLSDGGFPAGTAYMIANLPDIYSECEKSPERSALIVIWAAMGDNPENGFWVKEYGGQKMPKHTPNAKLSMLYELLCGLGFQLSDEEKALQDGTHELFGDQNKKGGITMKLYEVTEPYYALIAASDENQAKVLYTRVVAGDHDDEYDADDEEEGESYTDVFTMVEITEDEARQKYEAREDMEPGEPSFEQLISDAERDEEAALMLIDSCLI